MNVTALQLLGFLPLQFLARLIDIDEQTVAEELLNGMPHKHHAHRLADATA